MDLIARLHELNLDLPPVPKAVAVYVPVMRTGNLLIVSGQIPVKDGKPMAIGAVPAEVNIEAAQLAAEQCVLNGLAAIHAAIDGDWRRLVRFIRVGVFVNSSPGFAEQHVVANGASLLLEKIFADQGKHARAAVGAAGLPLGVPVEVEFTVEIKD